MASNEPVPASYADVAAILRDMAERVDNGDSFEGSIEYLIPGPGDPDCNVLVRASYRIGNSEGQGGIRLIGTLGGRPDG